MRTTTQIVTGLVLATAALINIPLAAADDSSNAAYEDFSGTHGNARQTAEGVRGSEGMKGEAGMAGSKPALPGINQAFEDYSGTHPAAAVVMAGLRGPSGRAGETGGAGKAAGDWSPFNIPGDVRDGCSKYLRCSNE
jgi:hypothetical protein